MLTIRRLSLGSGYKYLMDSIAQGDGAAQQSSALTRYYTESGTPPGVFAGSGLSSLGDGEGIEAGSQVDEVHLYRMLGLCSDPLTGDPVGRQTNKTLPPLAQRVERRLARLSTGLSVEERAVRRVVIETEERSRQLRARPPVAGFDLTFSPTKSVSVAWALADQGTKAVIYDCHRRAIDYTLAYAESHVLHSRSGRDGIVQEDIQGVIAASFTHYDSRSGDPQLHDHCVVWNRAKSVSDGQWRTLDSRGLFKQVVTLSELYDGVLSDLLTDALGVGWDRQATRNGMVKHEVSGVPEDLIREFSQRRKMIETWRDRLETEFRTTHGRGPTPVEKMRLNQQANLATRQDKTHRSLAEMTVDWQNRAEAYVGDDPVAWVTTLRDRNDLPRLRADDLAEDMLAEVAQIAADRVAERHATFSRANLLAEVHRQLHGIRFVSPDDRVAVAEHTTEIALGGVLQVTAPELHHTPQRYRRADGTSRLRPADHHLYTTAALLDAEQRLLEQGRRLDAPVVPVATVAAVTDTNLPGRDYRLSVDQALAVEKIATSGRRVDVLVGPAGTGKSTTMAGLRAVWEATHGAGSVIGLAPSAAAAEVLADELGIDTDNTAKWLHEHHANHRRADQLAGLRRRLQAAPRSRSLRRQIETIATEARRWELGPGQLVIVDEASLAGTFALDELATAASEAGAKLLLVGDPYQLAAVEAGGMFRALVTDRDDLHPELTDIRRFTQSWEKTASVQLRAGMEAALDAYQAHDRITGGDRDTLIERAYLAWKTDVDAGRSSLMIAADAHTVRELNQRARAERVNTGQAAKDGLAVADGCTAGVGDLVVTRQNDRHLTTGRGWVKNGDRWTVTATNHDGSMTVRRAIGSAEVVLPAAYVAEHVELAYATTAHRAQGRTVDTAHAIVTPATTREVLYVAATRGRESNRLYVDTSYDPDPDTGHDHLAETHTARQVLAAVLANEGGERSATDQIRSSWATAGSITQLHAEYTTLAQAAQADRWDRLLDTSGLTPEQVEQVRASAAYGPLLTALRDAETRGLNVEDRFPALVAARDFADAADLASVLHQRVDRWVEHAGTQRRQPAGDLIAGLIPRAKQVTDPDMARALTERDQAIEARAVQLAEQAVQTGAGWVRRLGQPPTDPSLRAAWMHQVRVVAAYRDRWNHTGPTPIDRQDQTATIEQIGHQKRAAAAARQALTISRQDRTRPEDHTPLAASVTVTAGREVER